MERMYIITGARGHLASTIIRYLRETPCRIRGLILPTEEGEDDGQITYYHGDITSPPSLEAIFTGLEGYDVIVIHAAGMISIGAELTPQLYEVNVLGTRHIIDQCTAHHVRRLVYVSSVHAIPETDRSATIEETDSFSRYAVSGAYAVTKAEATQAVMEAVKGGLDAVVVHPSGIVGPYDGGQNHVVQLVGLCLAGKLPAGVKGGYDFVDVRDVAKGCLSAAEKGVKGSCYILSNRFFSIAELLGYIRTVVGGPKRVCLPIGLARAFVPAFAWAAKLRRTRPLFTSYSLSTLAENAHFSHDRAAAELGYHPRDMRATIADTVAWLRGQAVPLERERR